MINAIAYIFCVNVVKFDLWMSDFNINLYFIKRTEIKIFTIMVGS